MAYPHNFIKVTFGGTIYDGADIWSNGLNFGKVDGDTGATAENLEGSAEALSGDISTWFTNEATRISHMAKLEWVKVAAIGVDGKYEFDADIFDLTPVSGGATTVEPAPQLTVAMTMETSRRRVPGRFARIFPPLNVPQIQATGRIQTGYTGPMRDQMVTLLNELNDNLSVLIATPLRAIVASEKTDQHYQIESVRVGDVVDTQRSRRNAFKESYTEPALLEAPAA